MQIMKLKITVYLLILISMLSACQMLEESGVVRKPEVSLSDISIKAISMQGVDLDVSLNVNNGNPIPINLSGYDYQLTIEGRRFLSGERATQTEVPASGVGKVSLPLALNFNELKALSEALSQKEAVQFGLSTTAFIDVPVLGRLAFPATKSGTVPLPKMPQISVTGFEVASMGLSGANLAVGVKVKNPNGFDINMQEMVSVLKVNGVAWLDGSVPNRITVKSKQAETIRLPVRLDYLTVGSNVMQLLQGSSPLSYQFSGGVTLDTGLPMLKNLRIPYDVSGKMSQW